MYEGRTDQQDTSYLNEVRLVPIRVGYKSLASKSDVCKTNKQFICVTHPGAYLTGTFLFFSSVVRRFDFSCRYNGPVTGKLFSFLQRNSSSTIATRLSRGSILFWKILKAFGWSG